MWETTTVQMPLLSENVLEKFKHEETHVHGAQIHRPLTRFFSHHKTRFPPQTKKNTRVTKKQPV